MLLTYRLMSDQYVRKIAGMLNIDNIDELSTNELKKLIVEKHDSFNRQPDGGSFADALRRAYKGKFDKKKPKKKTKKTTKKGKATKATKRKSRKKAVKKKAPVKKKRRIKPRGRQIKTPYIKKADEGVVRNLIKQELKTSGLSPAVERSNHLQQLTQLAKQIKAPQSFEDFEEYLTKNISNYIFINESAPFEQKLSSLWLLYKPLLRRNVGRTVKSKTGLAGREISYLTAEINRLATKGKKKKLTENQKKGRDAIRKKLANNKLKIDPSKFNNMQLFILNRENKDVKKQFGNIVPNKKKITSTANNALNILQSGKDLTDKKYINALTNLINNEDEYSVSTDSITLANKGISDYEEAMKKKQKSLKKGTSTHSTISSSSGTTKQVDPPKTTTSTVEALLPKSYMPIINKILKGKNISPKEFKEIVPKLIKRIEKGEYPELDDVATNKYLSILQKGLDKYEIKGPNKKERDSLSKLENNEILLQSDLQNLTTVKEKLKNNEVKLTDNQANALKNYSPRTKARENNKAKADAKKAREEEKKAREAKAKADAEAKAREEAEAKAKKDRDEAEAKAKAKAKADAEAKKRLKKRLKIRRQRIKNAKRNNPTSVKKEDSEEIIMKEEDEVSKIILSPAQKKAIKALELKVTPTNDQSKLINEMKKNIDKYELTTNEKTLLNNYKFNTKHRLASIGYNLLDKDDIIYTLGKLKNMTQEEYEEASGIPGAKLDLAIKSMTNMISNYGIDLDELKKEVKEKKNNNL